MSFKLLNSIYTYNGHAVLTPFLQVLFTLIFRRVMENKTPRFCKLAVHSFCVFTMINGANVLYDWLERISVGLTKNMVTQIWLPQADVCAAADIIDVNQMIVGGSKILCEAGVRDPETFVALLKALLPLLRQESSTAESASEVLLESILEEELAENREFDSTYSKLAFAQVSEATQPPEVRQSHSFFASMLSALCRSNPGVYLGMMQKALDQNEVAVVQEVFRGAGQVIV